MKAYNHYLMKDAGKARELVDAARNFLPESDEIRYLSGLLFYESGDLESALPDFLRAARRGNSNCYAQLYLGFIHQQLKDTGKGGLPVEGSGKKQSPEKTAVQYLVGAAACMESVVASLEYKIRTLESMDLGPKNSSFLKAGWRRNWMIHDCHRVRTLR